ncbi:MAG: polysaccharide biosynthesis C-terminal domain-containing protein [Bacteroidales bacterium]|nr:polysaccharide biosynthesis C-terminal domain-containing protein [Bacteroidales bacterium]MBN2749402.1 polysaccharide biosynthesis C-terminal domain-containing protein [Bacteroidales bacterium]
MKRKFASNLILLLTLNFLVKPFWIFGIDRTIQNIVGANEYGLYFALFNLSLLLNIALDFGLTNFNNREISQHNQLLPRFLPNLIAIKFILALLYVTVSLGLAVWLGYSGRAIWLLMVLAINQFLASFILYLRSNISGLQLFKTDSILSVIDRVLMIAICGILLWSNITHGTFKVEWLAYSQTLAYLVTALIAASIIMLRIKSVKIHLDITFARAIVRQSYPYALLVLLMSVYYRADSIMLERLLPNGAVEAGIYAQAFRVLDAFTMVPFLFAGLLLPMFSGMIKRSEELVPLISFASKTLLVPIVAIAVSCFVYRAEVMNALYHVHADKSAQILGIMMLTLIFSSVNYVYGTLLTANGNIGLLNKISAIGVVINLGLNLLLIPRLNALGAAISAAITQSVVALLQVAASVNAFNLTAGKRTILRIALFAIGSMALAMATHQAEVRWQVKLAVSLSTIIGLGLALRLIRIKEFWILLTKPIE